MNLPKLVKKCLETRIGTPKHYDNAIGCLGIGYDTEKDEFSSFSFIDVGHELNDGDTLSAFRGSKLLLREVMINVLETLKPNTDFYVSDGDTEEVMKFIISKCSK